MKKLILLMVFISAIATATTSAASQNYPKNFKCPESLPTDEAKQEALNDFLLWAQKQHKDWTLEQIIKLRVDLLNKYQCNQTLSNIKSSELETKIESPVRNLCTMPNGKKYFTNQQGKSCTPVPLEAGWINFSTSPSFIVDIMPDKMVKEDDGTKVWTQFFLAESVESDDGKWKYDQVKNISKFFCKKKQTLLIQGTYSQRGSRVYERSSRESMIEEIEPGTINESLYEFVCK